MSNGEPNVIHPGVYVVEIPAGGKAISGVETGPCAQSRVSPLLPRLGYWIWGSVLTGGLLFIGYVLWAASDCIDPAASTKDTVALGSCHPWVQRWYLVLRDWQTGIGAAIGLLGIAWSTFYKTVGSSKK